MTDKIPQAGAPSLDAAQPNRRIKVWHWALLALVALIATLGWYVTTQRPANTSTKPVPVAVAASAASAPDTVASAPALADQASSDNQEAAASAPKTHTVKLGDELLKLFGKDAKAVCELNAELLKGNCNLLKLEWVLNLPEGVTPREITAPVAASKRQAKPAAKPAAERQVAAPKTNDAGEILYRTVGRAPLLNCGKRDIADISKEAWNVLGLSEEDQAYLTLNADLANGPRINITADEGLMKLDTGIRLESVTFCRNGKVVAMGPMRTAWDVDKAVYGERFVLPSGKVLVWMRNCFNWVILPEEKTVFVPTPPPPEEPRITAAPVLPPELPSEPAPLPPPVVAESEPLCRFDPHAVLGQEHEPRHDGGDQADSTFVNLGLFCTWRNASDTGTHGLGLNLTASEWSGTVNQRAGKYDGNMYLFGPAYEFISDNGWDTTVSLPMYGKLKERFAQDKYRSTRDFDLLGLSAGANFYQRRLAGEKWLPEVQVFGTAAKPLSRLVAHSWDGQAIADTAELSRFGHYLNVGVRAWLYETDESLVLPYAQLGYFLETPSSESMSARLGISDPARIVGFGIGFDHDLKRGGNVAAWGWWLDIVKGVQVGRSMYRKHQVITDAAKRGVTVEENRKGNIESIRFGDTWKDEANKQ